MEEKTEKDKPFWVGFNVFSGVGPGKFKILLRVFGSAKEAWGAAGSELAPILGIKVWERFAEFRRSFGPEAYYRKVKAGDGNNGNNRGKINVLTLSEESYPKLLREIENAPPVLYCLGNSEILAKPQIAIVGSRKMTEYGARVARQLAGELAAAGFSIASGLAYGVDTVAHAAALEEGGNTVAVLGCGVDLCYPQEHIRVYEEIINCGKGAVISEIPPGINTNRGIFVARNRIIAGLSLGVIVVEGARKSGTLITAGYAAKYGREVFAVPGPITSVYSDGPNLLIKNGAKAATCVEDIIGEFKAQTNRTKAVKETAYIKELGANEKKIVKLLVNSGSDAAHIDTIIRKSGLKSGEVGSILSKLEIRGIVASFKDGRYGLT